MNYRISSDGSVAVSLTERYLPMDTCPLRVKVQVLTHGGIATYTVISHVEGRNDYKGWAPLPAKAEE